jgi:GH18 family chitinase
MRSVGYCLLAALTTSLACGDVDNSALLRPRPKGAAGGTGSNSNATSDSGLTPGRGETGGGANTATGDAGANGGAPGSSGGSSTTGVGGSGGTTSGSGGSGGAGTAGAGSAGGTGGAGSTGAGGSGAAGNGGSGAGGSGTGGSGTGGSGAGGNGTGGSGGAGTGGATGGKDAGAGGGSTTGGSGGAGAGAGIDAGGPGGSGGGSIDAGVGNDVVADRVVPPASGVWIAPNHPWYEWDTLPAAKVPWQHITHLGLGNVQPKVSSGKYVVAEPPGWGSGWTGFRDAAKVFADAAHAASRKAFMMVGAAQSNTGDYAGVWNAATSNANIDAFADSIVSTAKEMGLDGVELDWEEDINYPQLATLAKSVRARWADGLIFVDAMPLDAGAFAGLAPAKDDVDAFMPMTFLAIPQWGGWILPIPLTPLYGYAGNDYSVDDNLKKWTNAGVPAAKVIMGVGGFGTVWGDSNSDRTGPIAPYITTNGSGGANGENGSLYDDTIVTQTWVKSVVNGNAGRMIEGWDDTGKCSYWHAPATNDLVSVSAASQSIQASLIFYETPRSMTEKLNYARAQGMRGMNFWTLSQMMDGAASPILETVLP